MRIFHPKPHAALLLCLIQATAACAQSKPAPASEPGLARAEQGQVAFYAEHIHELSGIAYLGDENYLVVSDNDGAMANATISLDLETGAITESKISEQIITLAGRRDVEAVGIDDDCLLIIADEAGTIHRHHFPSGREVGRYDVPDIFQHPRPNLGFEAVAAIDPRLGRPSIVWAANEEALPNDGPVSSALVGTLVRLQRFSRGKPAGQFAYRTDPHRGADNVVKRAVSGVSGVVALNQHRLIVMERELGGSFLPSFRNRLYLVDTQGAMDTSEITSLADPAVTPVPKALLLEINAKLSNFEGITLGPQLNNGDYVLVLVSDDGGGDGYNPQNVLAVRVPRVIIEGESPSDHADGLD